MAYGAALEQDGEQSVGRFSLSVVGTGKAQQRAGLEGDTRASHHIHGFLIRRPEKTVGGGGLWTEKGYKSWAWVLPHWSGEQGT